MSISPGQNLLHYRILDKLGEGGMGVVYRAVDTSLTREVAIKILPTEGTDLNSVHYERFQREAQLLASLNHPNIATIHGLHEADTPDGPIRFLAMELVDGEDLSERIARGPIPVDDAIALAIAIADGLVAAHSNGVIHRDLKPANIRIASDGRIKILDFGLAKAFDPADSASGPSAVSLSNSPTLTSTGTQIGMILGTAAYMSPEQARGHVVDRRADIFAFGCVLYEMLTGQRAFAGDTVSDTLASILKDAPDIDALPADTPPAVRRALVRSLQKNPDQRLHDIADVRLELQDAGNNNDWDAPLASDPDADPGGRLSIVAIAAVVLIALSAISIAGALWMNRNTESPPQTRRLTLDTEISFENVFTQRLTFSPDGRSLIYSGGKPRSLMRRPLDQLNSSPIAGTEGAAVPFYSPDGKWIGFNRQEKIYKMPVEGGPTVELCDYDRIMFAAVWTSDGTIYFSALSPARNRATLYRVSDRGGEPEEILQIGEDERDTDFLYPVLLPGERSILFTRLALMEGLSPEKGRIEVLDLETLDRTVIFEQATYGMYAESGHIVAVGAQATIVAVPFDPARGVIVGKRVQMSTQVKLYRDWWPAIALSSDGTLIYVEGEENLNRSLLWIETDGSETAIDGAPRQYMSGKLSPDQSKIAFSNGPNGSRKISILDLSRGTFQEISRKGGTYNHPIWTPDGKNLIYEEYLKDGENRSQLFVHPLDITLEGWALAPSMEPQSPLSVSPDGLTLLFRRRSAETGQSGLWEVPLAGGEVTSFHVTDNDARNGVYSPDGLWVAFELDHGRASEIYLRRRDLPGQRDILISTGNHFDPRWTSDSRTLTYNTRKPDRTERVQVNSDGTIGSPEIVMTLPEFPDGRPTFFDRTNNGRALAARKLLSAESRQIVVLNWFEELKRLAPPD